MQHTLIEQKQAINRNMITGSTKNKRADTEEIEIESRFGLITAQPAKAIAFPHGIPGIPGSLSFCLVDMPNIKNPQFKLLQCMNDHALSFIVVPSAYDNQLLESVDVEDACAVLGIKKVNLLILFIVTSHETPAGRRLSVNAKAPVFVDAISKIATQYVFQNNNYEIQHFIS